MGQTTRKWFAAQQDGSISRRVAQNDMSSGKNDTGGGRYSHERAMPWRRNSRIAYATRSGSCTATS
jgi:hypothetical protein